MRIGNESKLENIHGGIPAWIWSSHSKETFAFVIAVEEMRISLDFEQHFLVSNCLVTFKFGLATESGVGQQVAP